MRSEQEHPHLVTAALGPVSGAVLDQTTIAAKEEDAGKPVPRGRDAQQAVVAGLRDEEAGTVSTRKDRAGGCGGLRETPSPCIVHDGDPVVAEVDHPDVTELGVGIASGGRRSVAVDRVAVQVEGDVVGADDDAVVGAVDEVVVEGRVGGDRVAALRLLGGLRPPRPVNLSTSPSRRCSRPRGQPQPRPGSPQGRRTSRVRRGGEAWLASGPPLLSGRAGGCACPSEPTPGVR